MRRAERAEFEWLFRAAYPSVRRSVYLVTRDVGRAEEVTQDAFVRLYEKWSTVSGYEHPEAWVRKVAIRMAIRAVARDRRRPVLESASATPIPDAEPPDVALADAVSGLTPMQRAAVVLYYFEDRPVLEVARVLQVSESTVKQHLHRARSRLAAVLGEEVDDDVR